MNGLGTSLTSSSANVRWRAGALLVGVVLVAAVAVALVAARSDGGSLHVYRVAATKLVHGQDMYERTPGVAAFSYPAVLALPVVPLLTMSQWMQAVTWQFINVLMLIGCLLLLRRCIDPMLPADLRERGRLPWYAYVLFALLAGRHLISPVESRSHDLIIFAAMLLAAIAYRRGRGIVAGAWGGLAAALKATPLLLLPLFLWQRRFWASLAFVLVLTAATLLPDLIYPRSDGRLWSVAWYQKFVSGLKVAAPADREAWVAWNQLNQNLAGTVYRLSRSPEPRPTPRPDVSLWHPSEAVLRGVTLALQLGLLMILAACTHGGRTRGLRPDELATQRIGEFALVLCAMSLLSPMSSKAHFCVLALPIAYCLSDFLFRRHSAVLGALLLIVFILGTLTVKNMIGRRLGNLFLAYGSVMWCTVALLLATIYVMHNRLRDARRCDRRLAEAPSLSHAAEEVLPRPQPV